MIVLVLLWTLTWTAPATQAAGPVCPATASAVPLACICRFEVWRQRQSPTWLARRAAMEADPVEWARWWPVVRAEAAPELLGTIAASAPGANVVASLPDTLPAGWFYFVRTVGAAGPSCPSNVVWR